MRKAVGRRLVAAAAVVGLFTVGVTAPAQAYNLTGAKWSSGNIRVQISAAYSGTAQAWLDAIDDWNYTDVNMTRPVGNQPFQMYDVNISSVSWDGYTTWSPSTGTLASVGAELNYYFTKNYAATTTRGVAAHEIGHGLGLAHRDGCYLMTPYTSTRQSCGIFYTTSDEIAAANALY